MTRMDRLQEELTINLLGMMFLSITQSLFQPLQLRLEYPLPTTRIDKQHIVHANVISTIHPKGQIFITVRRAESRDGTRSRTVAQVVIAAETYQGNVRVEARPYAFKVFVLFVLDGVTYFS